LCSPPKMVLMFRPESRATFDEIHVNLSQRFWEIVRSRRLRIFGILRECTYPKRQRKRRRTLSSDNMRAERLRDLNKPAALRKTKASTRPSWAHARIRTTFNSTAVVCAPRGSLEDGSIMIRSSQNTSMRRLHCFRLIRISSVFVGIALVLSLARARQSKVHRLSFSRPVRSWEFWRRSALARDLRQ